MTGLVLVSTLMRYLVGRPIGFSDELSGLLFLSLSFLSLPHVLNTSQHIRIDLLVRALPSRMAAVADIFANAILVAFASIFAYQAWDFMTFSLQIGARSEISGVLLWPWMALMPLSMLLCILIVVRNGLRGLTHNGDRSSGEGLS
ncbi:TRAP transporter small permease [Halomonas sp. McH1-25]|uniref:TRAP transporter small permease n=1 Tax=unclassified Halomonas TaxID=2609666 RepID=UPI001EF42BFC|nr:MULTISPECIES: TRAP transporter small permease [unclassified Halomonas]MCG7599286.1 TRAP transporter small permease [Halomonas sp. McH1-25]MCP1341154.1 TRAP transporter small permease [Halomonas sp. FL8]MCP1360252.1 TRAP transporter small permease [Halomonas sp. BBD45]MCP1365396.1 TRAP transporter small permease [Halomonas sp. BBD48]